MPYTVLGGMRKDGNTSRGSRGATRRGGCENLHKRGKGKAAIKVEEVEQPPEGGCKGP